MSLAEGGGSPNRRLSSKCVPSPMAASAALGVWRVERKVKATAIQTTRGPNACAATMRAITSRMVDASRVPMLRAR
eukprot:7168627-Prymnesium_polylepis.1